MEVPELSTFCWTVIVLNVVSDGKTRLICDLLAELPKKIDMV
jgi:hypothetical protein